MMMMVSLALLEPNELDVDEEGGGEGEELGTDVKELTISCASPRVLHLRRQEKIVVPSLIARVQDKLMMATCADTMGQF